ncbi:MAG: hypothetical protein ACP5GY_07855 [Vulcanisaeta sp.]
MLIIPVISVVGGFVAFIGLILVLIGLSNIRKGFEGSVTVR